MEINKIKKNNVFVLNKNRIKCPTCKKPSSKSFKPFCSKKCADMDLAKWLSDEHSPFVNLE